MGKQRRFIVYVDEELYQAVKIKAIKASVSVADTIRAWLRSWTHGEIDTPENGEGSA